MPKYAKIAKPNNIYSTHEALAEKLGFPEAVEIYDPETGMYIKKQTRRPEKGEVVEILAETEYVPGAAFEDRVYVVKLNTGDKWIMGEKGLEHMPENTVLLTQEQANILKHLQETCSSPEEIAECIKNKPENAPLGKLAFMDLARALFVGYAVRELSVQEQAIEMMNKGYADSRKEPDNTYLDGYYDGLVTMAKIFGVEEPN